MTKKEASQRKADWQLALAEQRVLRTNDGMTLTSYPTIDAARVALVAHVAAGMVAEIVIWES